MATLLISSQPVVLFLTISSCFLVFSPLFRGRIPAPCSAFLAGWRESCLFSAFGEKALQGARILREKTPFSRVFSCFLLFLDVNSGLPTHHFCQKVAKGHLLTAFDRF